MSKIKIKTDLKHDLLNRMGNDIRILLQQHCRKEDVSNFETVKDEIDEILKLNWDMWNHIDNYNKPFPELGDVKIPSFKVDDQELLKDRGWSRTIIKSDKSVPNPLPDLTTEHHNYCGAKDPYNKGNNGE